MKTILVPTDFSEVAENAINYAAEIASLTHAQIILFNAYLIPIVAAEDPLAVATHDELKKESMESLRKIERKLHVQYGTNLSIQCVCKYGLPVEEINQYAAKHNVNLIIMGMQGAGYFAEKLMGSTTTSLIRIAECPVLAIDKEVKFRNIKKIVLACDYEDTENEKILEPLKEFVRIFESHVYVLNVVRELEPASATPREVSDFITLEHALADVEHSFHYLNSEEIVKGINEFVTEGKMDMVVMIPRKHSLLKNIFQEGNTKQMAFHSKVPILALH